MRTMADPAAPPLATVRVVVTRAEQQTGALVAALREAGATVELLPLLEVVLPVDPAPLAKAAAGLALFDWVLFTSANAVRSLLPAAAGGPLSTAPESDGAQSILAGVALPPGLRVAAVGDATAGALRSAGVEPALLAPAGEESAGGLLAAILPRLSCGDRVLLPQAADALPTLRDGLLAAGISAVSVTAYEKRRPAAAPAHAAALFTGQSIGWVTFSSPSIARHFAALFGAAWEARRHELRAASIGPVTSAELRRHGVEPAAEAPRPAPNALVAAIAAAVRRLDRDA